ncbi:MAG: hypothetical protein ACYC0X_32905 [Pirellulaceae bacterium]
MTKKCSRECSVADAKSLLAEKYSFVGIQEKFDTSLLLIALHFGRHLGFAAFFILYFFYGGTMWAWLTFSQVFCVAIVLSPNYRGVLQTETTSRIVARRKPPDGELVRPRGRQCSEGVM